MREIKFRIWLRAIAEVNGYSAGQELVIYNSIFDRKNGVAFYPIDFKYEIVAQNQYTGLKDKNGKDVYTGDFVRQSNTLYEIRDCVGGWECQIWQELKNGGAIEGSCYVFSCLSEKYCEVIGNIYENPELIK